MRPEAAAHLATAHHSLVRAHGGMAATASVPAMAEGAARDAYYAAFHAAQALIVERTGHEPKSHAGVHRMFHKVSRNEAAISQVLRTFLIAAYDYKSIADYSTAPPPRISAERATSAVVLAEEFVSTVERLLMPGHSDRQPDEV